METDFDPSDPLSYTCHGISVREALRRFGHRERNLHGAESWAGKSRVCRGLTRRKLKGIAWDKIITSDHDLTDPKGFLCWAEMLCGITVEGLHHMGVECRSMHRFINAKNGQRTPQNPNGRIGYAPVDEGNLFGRAMAWAMILGYERSFASSAENPDGSFLYDLTHTKPVLDWLEEQGYGHKCLTYLCMFFKKKKCPKKPARLFATRKFIERMKRVCNCPPKRHLALMRKNSRGGICPVKIKFSKQNHMLSSNKRKTRMKESQTYPTDFAECLVQYWHGECGSVAERMLPPLQHAEPLEEIKSDFGTDRSDSDSEQGYVADKETAGWKMEIHDSSSDEAAI